MFARNRKRYHHARVVVSFFSPPPNSIFDANEFDFSEFFRAADRCLCAAARFVVSRFPARARSLITFFFLGAQRQDSRQ